MAFKIQETQPFVIEGQKGTYEIPPFSTLSVDDVAEVMQLKPNTPLKVRLAACKNFLLKFAPELEQEGLGDMGYSQIFSAYEKEMKLGK